MTLAPFTSRQYRGSGQRNVTPVYRWGPYRDIEEINNQFNQLVRTFFGDTSAAGGTGAWSPVTPPIDVEETDDAYVVDVDLPNVNPDEVDVEMRGEELRITGRFQQREREGVVRRQSRPMGDFEYVVDLPSDIDPNRVEATYDSGVLMVTVGKARDARPRKIEIRGAQRQRQQLGQGEARGEAPGGAPGDAPRDQPRDQQQAAMTESQQAMQGDEQRA
ncbi:MAG: hypothetical protein AUI14_16325 [Actinobacteria bacterium 13_2_20CM_2_71_6]|nr:MAG: hypothetical protein AUI14_16325 [Actinobacteria bacterium 13_2_20CM_2_71_6]